MALARVALALIITGCGSAPAAHLYSQKSTVTSADYVMAAHWHDAEVCGYNMKRKCR